ncbi:MAG: response regulator [Bacteroidetes bacterium]|nr:response regulator [Bacteroidota bacterium]
MDSRALNILLVEDEAMNALYFKMVLTKAGHFVNKVVGTGEDAVSSANEERPDLILMDIRLAGKMDGIEAAEIIKANFDIPIIFMTGYQDTGHMERAKLLNPIKYFIKPINTQDLLSSINSAFKKIK